MGNQTRNFIIEDKDNNSYKIVCKECCRKTSHSIVVTYRETGSEICGHGHTVDWVSQNQIIQCLGCDFISFRVISTNSEDSDYDEDSHSIYYPETIKYYPGRTEELKSVNIHLLPNKVQSIYKETILAIENEQNVLAGIGIRALIETICKDQNADGENLFEKINSLKLKSILTNDGADTLHKLRTLGNNAAHEVKAHTKDQLFLALQIVDHMLDGTYIIPQRVSQVFPHKP